MTCGEVRNILEPFFDGELPGAHMREVARHLAACRPCEGAAVRLEHAQEAVRQAVLSAVGQPNTEAAWNAVASQLDQPAPSFAGRLLGLVRGLAVPRIPAPMLVGGAAAALGMFLLWAGWGQIAEVPDGNPQLLAQQTRIDELEAPGSVHVWNAPGSGATVIWVDEEGLSVETLDP
jgi:anti-sigma factor RsiW